MKLRSAILTFCLPTLALAAGTSYALQDHGKGGGQGDDPMAGFEMPKPTKEHEWLKDRVGTWTCTVSCAALGEPTEGKETVSAFGDFWTIADFEGSMMGMPFKGKSLATYDPIKEKFISTWCDTSMPHLTVMEGTLDESSKVLTSKGMSPNMEGQVVEWTSTFEVKGPDHAVFTIYETSHGADSPMAMSIEYHRAK